MLHYRFQADFCNPASGNVENKVGYIRRNAFVPIPTISNFDNFNERLFEWCEKDADRQHYQRKVTIQSLWEEESAKLLTLPEVPYNVFRYEAVRVSKTGFVSIDTNKYGLSPELHDETVQAKIFYDRIEFYHDHALVANYRRSYGKNEELMDWTQYIRTLCRKPGAAEHTRFFTTMPQQWQNYLTQMGGQERRSALQLLDDIVRDGNAEYCVDILVLARQNGRSDVDSVKQCY
jgi:glycogen debranching enzyme